MTRGHHGSLLLRCRAFSSLSSCRFIPALSPRSVQKQQTGLTSPTCRTPPGQSAVHPPGSSRADLLHPGFDATLLSNDTSTAIPETEDCAPSFRSPPDASCAPFPHRSPRRSSATAACGGLKPPTAGRLRRANLHLLHSTVSKKLYLQTELLSTFVAHVASQTSWRMPMRLPEGFQDSHQDGGPLFLIFVADPRTVRWCTTHLAEERILIRRDFIGWWVAEHGELPARRG